jgi:predicted house-cleaning NTP pyrophosphatase (Maf/HAM1 superfamily)
VDERVVVGAATMNSAKSTRRVRLLARIGSPTWRLHTGRPSLSPSSRSLPRTTVQRVSLAKIRRQASTWSSRSAKRVSRAIQPKTFTRALNLHE